jgi:hypothetical protein
MMQDEIERLIASCIERYAMSDPPRVARAILEEAGCKAYAREKKL